MGRHQHVRLEVPRRLEGTESKILPRYERVEADPTAWNGHDSSALAGFSHCSNVRDEDGIVVRPVVFAY